MFQQNFPIRARALFAMGLHGTSWQENGKVLHRTPGLLPVKDTCGTIGLRITRGDFIRNYGLCNNTNGKRADCHYHRQL